MTGSWRHHIVLDEVESLLVELEDFADETDEEIEERWENIKETVLRLREINQRASRRIKARELA